MSDSLVPDDIDDHELNIKKTMGMVLHVLPLVGERSLCFTTQGVYVVSLSKDNIYERDTIHCFKSRGIEVKEVL
jgi:hypothetical protein